MINIEKSAFLLPKTSFRRLAILMAIHNSDQVSQHKIAHETNLSSSMVNTYIKQLSACGSLTITNRNNRDCDYQLTKQGQQELNSLLMNYSAEIVQFYAQTRSEISRRLKKLFSGKRQITVVLFGASDTCELAMRALGDIPQANIVGIVDSNPTKHGVSLNGVPIQPPEIIESINPDYVLITSYAKQDEIYEATKHLIKKGIKIRTLSES